MKTRTFSTPLLLVLLTVLVPLNSWAAAGKVVIAAGDVFAVDAQDQRRALQRRSDIFEGDTLVTGADGRLQLRFEDNAILALRADSQLRISEYHGATDTQSERVLMDLLGGGFRTISGSFGKSERDAYQVRTPNASIGIRGTHYEAVFQSETLTVGVYEGGIVLTNDQGSLNLGLDSDFVFAQVQAGNLPQGLLNPPANLNVPNTPETGSDEDGDEDDSNDEDGGTDADNGDGDLTNDSAEGPTDDPDTGVITSADTNNDFDTGDFNLSDLEDAFIELQEKSVVLTDAERAVLNSGDITTGIVVFAPSDTGSNGQPISENGPILVTTGTIFNEQQPPSSFYIAYDGQDLSNNLYDPPNFILRPDENSFLENQGDTFFNWQEWSSDGGVVGVVDAGNNTGFNSGGVDQPFFYIEVEPTTAALSGEGVMTFSNSLSNMQTNLNLDSSFANLTVDLGTLAADGNIYLSTSDELSFSEWDIGFSGQVTGSTLNADVTSPSQLTHYDNSDESIIDQLKLDGNVSGVFTGQSGEMQFVGGFTAETTSESNDEEVYGVFTLEEFNGQEPNF
ncbi:hypothetical protein BGP77_06960 [Saccharospirillum sp. MSK14-1]|uniref:FecR family protein n=1 Tax=Saccharospirillum sp. MSK14-1 TaxID=1897632 RepID=UPI000D36BBD0|nr:FecR family protein [Saccharospirillum sp. MSK14-1]PTY37017.1 hypothetical protein BGP77_06960 [Saccharospirillum sp. MSK14-1]